MKKLHANLLLLMLVLGCSAGCTMSLEGARMEGIRTHAKQINVSTAMAADRSECVALDNIQRYWGYSAIATGPIAPAAAGIAIVPGIGAGTKDALLVTAGVAAAITLFEMAEQQNFAGQWATQCSLPVAP